MAYFLSVSVQFTMSSLSALMLTMNFGKTCLFIQTTCLVLQRFCWLHVCVCVCFFFSEDVLPSIHVDPEYPCELVGTWNTWYGEQDQAGKKKKSYPKTVETSKNHRALKLTDDAPITFSNIQAILQALAMNRAWSFGW